MGEKINVNKIKKYKTYGRALKLDNGKFEVIVTLDIGPRIIHFSLLNGKNIFADEVKLEEKLPNGKIYRFYGGHRVWHSPESFPRSYMCDSNPLDSYELFDNGIIMRQKEEEWTHIEKTVELHFTENSIKVKSSLTNKGAWTIEMAVWSLIIGSLNGREILPVTQRQTGLLHNTHYVSWSYSRMNDPRVYWGQKYIVVDHDENNTGSPFKLGYPNEMGWMAYFNKNMCFVKKYLHELGAKYSDMGSSWQTHSAHWGIDIESLSPLRFVKPGETISHEEEWFIFSAPKRPNISEEEITAVLTPIAEKADFALPVVSVQKWDPSYDMGK